MHQACGCNKEKVLKLTCVRSSLLSLEGPGRAEKQLLFLVDILCCHPYLGVHVVRLVTHKLLTMSISCTCNYIVMSEPLLNCEGREIGEGEGRESSGKEKERGEIIVSFLLILYL